MNLGNFTPRTDVLDTDVIVGERGTQHVGLLRPESRWTGLVIRTFLAGYFAAKAVSSVTTLKAIVVTGLASGYTVNVLGYTTAGDGGGGYFRYDSASAAADNGGTIIAPSVGIGRWVRLYNGVIDVRMFGATGNGITDDTPFFTSVMDFARSVACSVFVPRGTYLVKNINLSGISRIFGEGGLYVFSSIIQHHPEATTDLMTFDGAVDTRPSLQDLYLAGAKETNLRNMRTIATVASRVSFTVSSAPPGSINGSLCFFFTALDNGGYRYLGTGTIQTVVGTTVTLIASSDLYATTGANLPLVGWKVCFAQEVTESTLTVIDPTAAGYCGLNITGIGGYVQLSRVRFSSFHCAIRRGLAIALKTDEIFISKSSLAGIFCPFQAGSDDVLDNVYIGGPYERQDGLVAESIAIANNANYRQTAYGVVLKGTSVNGSFFQIYQCRVNMLTDYLLSSMFDALYLDLSVFDNIQINNSSNVAIGLLSAQGIGFNATNTYSILSVSDSKVTVGHVETGMSSGICAKYLVTVPSANGTDVRIRGTQFAAAFSQGWRKFTDNPLIVKITDPLSAFERTNRRNRFGTDGTSYVSDLISKTTTVLNRSGETAAASSADQAAYTVTRAAGAYTFTSADIGRLIVWGANEGTAWAVIRSITSGTVVVVDRSQTVGAAAFTIINITPVARFVLRQQFVGAFVSARFVGTQSTNRMLEAYAEQDAVTLHQDLGSNYQRLLVFCVCDPAKLATSAGRLIYSIGLAFLSGAGTGACSVNGRISIVHGEYGAGIDTSGGTVSQVATTVTRVTGARDFTSADIGRIIDFGTGEQATIIAIPTVATATVMESQTVTETGYNIHPNEDLALV